MRFYLAWVSMGVTSVALNGCFQVGDDDAAAAGQAGQAGDDGKTGGSSMGGSATGGAGGSNSAGSSMGGDTSKGGRDTSSFIGRGGTKSSGGAGAKPSSGGTGGDAGAGADGGTGGTGKGGSGGTGGSSKGGSGGTGGTGGTGATGPGSCNDYSAKLNSCGLISTSIECSLLPTGIYADCYLGCVSDAPCDEVIDGMCSAEASNDLVDCVTACGELTFDCGSPGTILAQYVCDGSDDCGNGNDEASCPTTTFACGDGTTIQASYRCDSYADCENGADEANCPTLTCPLPPAPKPGEACGHAGAALKSCNLLPGGIIQACMDRTEARACRAECFATPSCADLTAFFCSTEGAKVQKCLDDCDALSDEFPCKADNVAIPASWLCDETSDCSDGADEVGCLFTCGNGTQYPMSYLCDGIADCTDSSDEAGCSAMCPAAAK